MSLFTEKERGDLCYMHDDDPEILFDATERSAKNVLDALFVYKRKDTALGFTYKAYAVTEHLFLDTLDQLTTAIAAARVQENERCARTLEAIGCQGYADALRALLGKEQS